MSFSQRIGLKPVRSIIQRGVMDNELKNAIWNDLFVSFFGKFGTLWESSRHAGLFTTAGNVWCDFFNRPMDEVPEYPSRFISFCKVKFFGCPWNEVYDFTEYLVQQLANPVLIDSLNSTFTKYMAAYRLVNLHIVEITSEQEIAAIEESLQGTDGPWIAHIERALGLMSDRKNPDYRNSVKESISAVESMCKVISGNEKATLGSAITIVEKKHKLHSALKIAFEKLYSYTSDSGGIRHALMDQSNVTVDDAKFMLISCSAFLNYLSRFTA